VSETAALLSSPWRTAGDLYPLGNIIFFSYAALQPQISASHGFLQGLNSLAVSRT
jgi:hypothetical protein